MTLFENHKSLCGIQYHGEDGITSYCLDAIVRLIHFGDRIEKACLLTHKQAHGFLLFMEYERLVAVKPGFASGYPGEGPRGLSTALQLLNRHCDCIEEFDVDCDMLKRLGDACLLDTDIEKIEQGQPRRPTDWHDYIIHFKDNSSAYHRKLNTLFPFSVPFGLMDERITDIALHFDRFPNDAVLKAARRLEDIIRKRTGLAIHGGKLFSSAFLGGESPLWWGDIDGGEHTGRAQLFTSVFMAYRNRRAHQEIESSHQEALREFMLLNELFLLEAEAVERPDENREISK